MQEDGLVLIDVREAHEWQAGRPAGAIHVPMGVLAANEDLVPQDKPVAFICLSGVRSGRVTAAFQQRGYDVHNVAGGFHAWFQDGLPSEPDDARVAGH